MVSNWFTKEGDRIQEFLYCWSNDFRGCLAGQCICHFSLADCMHSRMHCLNVSFQRAHSNEKTWRIIDRRIRVLNIHSSHFFLISATLSTCSSKSNWERTNCKLSAQCRRSARGNSYLYFFPILFKGFVESTLNFNSSILHTSFSESRNFLKLAGRWNNEDKPAYQWFLQLANRSGMQFREFNQSRIDLSAKICRPLWSSKPDMNPIHSLAPRVIYSLDWSQGENLQKSYRHTHLSAPCPTWCGIPIPLFQGARNSRLWVTCAMSKSVCTGARNLIGT